MKRMYFSGFTFAMALVGGGHVLAEGPETQIMLAMIKNVEFITQNSSLEYSGQVLPSVTVVTEHELQLEFRAAAIFDPSLEKNHSSGRVSAFYDRHANKIYLTDETAVEGAGLFHELVHFLQDINGKDDMLPAHRLCLEAEAYELQSIWQTENGIDAVSKPEYGFVMMLYGACNDADFSWIERAYTYAEECADADPSCGQISD